MLPPDYDTWDRNEKVRHWTGNLYRYMRSAGEDGHEEISIFDAALLDRLRRADPTIDTLMPSILTYIARMWLEEPAGFVARANGSMGTLFPVDADIVKMRFGISGGGSRSTPQRRKPWWKVWG